jgi:alpha-ketoglutarate-dependent 2,4-dichlorophenoxyacetate dioxygenase
MAIEVRQLHPLFAGEVHGVNLAEPLDEAAVKAVWDAIHRYAVLVFHGKTLLSDDQQVAFAGHFGTLETFGYGYRGSERSRFRPEIADVSNLSAQGTLAERDARRRLRGLANRLWHTDSSFKRVPGALSMLHAHAIPTRGGETEFADLRAAYDALDEGTKAKIQDLVALHHYEYSRAKLGFTDFNAEEKAALPPVPQRLVRRIPGSGRRTLYLASHASHILGWPLPEGRMLIQDLMEHATQPAFVYRHTWQVGDFVIWDNRCTMHRARPFDETQRRDMRRITTSDVASTLDQEPVPMPVPMPA